MSLVLLSIGQFSLLMTVTNKYKYFVKIILYLYPKSIEKMGDEDDFAYELYINTGEDITDGSFVDMDDDGEDLSHQSCGLEFEDDYSDECDMLDSDCDFDEVIDEVEHGQILLEDLNKKHIQTVNTSTSKRSFFFLDFILDLFSGK